jgi:hypothetical protein
VLVVTDRLRLDAKMVQQHPRPARVFTGDQVDLTQHAQRALRDIFEVADWRGDNVKRAGRHATILSLHSLSQKQGEVIAQVGF